MRYSARRRLKVLLLSTVAIAGSLGVGAIASTAGGSPAVDILDGKLLIAHGVTTDNPSGSFHTMQAAVKTDKGFVKIRIPHSGHEKFMALAGRKVRVRGTKTAAVFNAESAAPADGQPANAQVAAAPRAMRIAVVLMHLPGSTTEAATKAQSDATFFGATNSVASWMSEVSSGQVQVTGKVYGYYDTQVKAGDCDLAHWQNDAERAAAVDGYVRSNYDHIVAYSPNSGCGYAGIAWIRANGVYLNNAMTVGVAVHELGHNLGPWHSGTLKCPGVYGGSCTRSDYGDPFDVMGQSSRLRHYSAYHKNVIGWLPAANVRTVSSGTATIDLTASEQLAAGTTQLISVPIPGTSYKYMIERRASVGLDSGLNGVWVRLQGAANSSLFGTDDVMLLDMTPTTNGTFTDGNLAAGKSYTDSSAGISINVLSDTATSPTAQVQVCFGTCTTTTSTTTPSTSSTTTSTTVTTVAPTTTTTKATTTTTTTVPPSGGTVSAAIVNKVLTIVGTDASETITVTKVRNNRYTVEVTGAAVTLGYGCTRSLTTITCTGDSVRIDGGAGNDDIRVVGSVKSVQNGGAGNDKMRSGASADVFNGGIGTDTVDYSSRIGETITGTPGTGADDGTRREHDNIGADVEQVLLP
jgi:hypothetical protein